MVNSINTNIAAYYAQANIGIAANAAASSVSRLSSGNRIVRAADDVAALSTGTSLRTNVSALRIALVNASQGTSLLSVADGGLSQITEILQRQKAIALQAGSGSLTNSDRVFLDQEFQSLVSEIDRLTDATNFNGVKLINGSLSQSAAVSGVTSAAASGTAQITFTDNILDTETIILSGVTLEAKDSPSTTLQFQIGANIAETVNNLATFLNNLADNPTYAATIGQAKYTAVGNSLQITSRTGGALGNNFTINVDGTAVVSKEATVTGGFAGAQLTVFATGFASATAQVVDNPATATAPFKAADTITATIGGVAKTLHTLVDGQSLTDIVNGINGNADTTGVKATLVFSGTTYNIRLSYNDINSNAIISLGANYDSTTHGMNGFRFNASTNVVEAAGAGAGDAIFWSGLVTLGTDDINVADTTTDITDGTPDATKPFKTGDVITATINGSTYVLHTLAGTETLAQIVTAINTNGAALGIKAVITGAAAGFGVNVYFSDPNGTPSFSPGAGAHAAVGAVAHTRTGATLTQTDIYGLNGGADTGLGIGSTAVTGTVGDNLMTSLSQSVAQVTAIFTQNATAGQTLTVGGKVFTFTATSSGAAPDEILIGSTLAATLDNAVTTLNSYRANGHALGTTLFEMNQLDITRSGTSLIFKGKTVDNVTTLSGSGSSVATNVTGASLTNSGNLDNASATFGVYVDRIANEAFQGQIGGFTATYKSNDTVDVSIKVGDYTYIARNVDTTATATTRIRFYSDTLANGTSGGSFDVQLQANNGTVVTDQAGATTFAGRLDAAFSSLSFLQQRNVSSYNGTQSIIANSTVIGSLLGTSVTAQLDSFDNVNLTDVEVLAPSGSNIDAKITLTINGVEFSTATGLGSTLGAFQTYTLVSAEDPNQFVTFTTGSSSINISSTANANAVEDAIRNAFGAGTGSSALSFQIGTSSTDTLSVSIGSATSDSLFSGVAHDVLTQSNATAASAALDIALATVTSLRAGVGALQSRFNFASASIQIAVQNQDAARGELLDTDIATEATNYATAQVKLQAGISVLAQANQQLQSLLKLIG